MGSFEETFIYPKIKEKCISYLRYIDDIFIIWNGTKQEFEEFIVYINNCHSTIKFDYTISNDEVNFLDTTVYRDINNTLRTKLYTKPTDRQSYLHHKSEHPPSLKKSIAYSQALRLRKICYDPNDLQKNCSKLLNTFVTRGYNKNDVQLQINKAINTPREEILKEKIRERDSRLPLIVTYNRILPNIKEITKKHWPILKIDRTLQDVSDTPPLIAYRRNKNLRDLIGCNNIINNRKVTQKINLKTGKCEPFNGRAGNLCCKQITNTNNTFKSSVTGKEYKIFHNVNCKSTYLIYLMECKLCNKQYVGKSEWQLNRRINLHRNDVWRTEGPPCDKHFQKKNHEFNTHAKFTVIEKLEHVPTDKKKTRTLLERKEDQWMLRLKTIIPQGLNIGLNYPQDTTGSIW